jgi:hypothetical protein
MNWPPQQDQDSLFVSPREPDQVVTMSSRPRLLGRVAVTAILVLAVQGGVFWQLHRSSAAKRQQVAVEMQDFEARAQVLRSEMAALQGRLGQAQGALDQLQAVPAATVSTSAAVTGTRPVAAHSPIASKPARPSSAQATRPARPSSAQATRPAAIVLSPGCTSTPLGC